MYCTVNSPWRVSLALCMCVCAYCQFTVCVHVCVCACICAYVCASVRACVRACMCVCTHIRTLKMNRSRQLRMQLCVRSRFIFPSGWRACLPSLVMMTQRQSLTLLQENLSTRTRIQRRAMKISHYLPRISLTTCWNWSQSKNHLLYILSPFTHPSSSALCPRPIFYLFFFTFSVFLLHPLHSPFRFTHTLSLLSSLCPLNFSFLILTHFLPAFSPSPSSFHHLIAFAQQLYLNFFLQRKTIGRSVLKTSLDNNNSKKSSLFMLALLSWL